MKRILVIIFIAVSALYAQDNNKGRISFIFNDEKIDLPFTSVFLQYENKILISARAEYNDSTLQETVAVELGFKKLSPEKSARSFPIKFDINIRDNANKTGKYLSLRYDDNGLESGNEKNDFANYGVYNKGEKVNWDINTLHLSFDVTNVIYTGKELKITGNFSGTFSSTLAPKGQVAEIKDGKFEIII